METKKILEELRRETEYYSPHTQSQYFSHVQDYLKYVGSIHAEWQDRDVLYNYQQKLKKKGHSQSHVNYIIRGPIGSLFRAHGLQLPIKLPRVRVSGSIIDLLSRVSFTSEEIIALIQAARQGSVREQAVFAIDTIYGPRISEILGIRPDDVHPKKKTLVIHTLKGGVWREHLVPEQIQPFVFGYDYPTLSHNQYYLIFNEVSSRAGIIRATRKVFHAVRHGLFSAMIHEAGIEEATAYEFMRWMKRDMIGVYAPYNPKNDLKVFEKHPFLEYWG